MIPNFNDLEKESSRMFEKLMKEIEYAKASAFPIYFLYGVKGKIDMAYELQAITKDEYLKLSHECVAKGINNPAYFNK